MVMWDMAKIGSVAKLIGGYAFKSGDFISKGVPVIKIKNIEDQNLSLDDADCLPESFLEIADKYKILYGDVLISMTGSHITMPASAVGRVAKSRFSHALLLNQRVGKFQVNEKLCNNNFLYYCAISPQFREQIGLRSRGAANQANVSGGDIEGIEMPLPPLPIQKKIAGILSAYDDLIENNLKRIKLLEEMAQITYEEWFVRLRFPGHKTTPINSETGLPEGWLIDKISSICDVNKESITVRNAPETIKYIDISSAETGSYSMPEEMPFSQAPSRARRKVSFGDVIFSTVRPNRRVYSLILEDDPLLIASTGFAVLTPHKHQNFPFIYLTINQQSFTDSAVAVAGGAAYPAINQTDFTKIKITIPTDALINQFSNLFLPNFILKGKLLRENIVLREARDILLPRLMTGMIDVEQYNPAGLLKEVA